MLPGSLTSVSLLISNKWQEPGRSHARGRFDQQPPLTMNQRRRSGVRRIVAWAFPSAGSGCHFREWKWSSLLIISRGGRAACSRWYAEQLALGCEGAKGCGDGLPPLGSSILLKGRTQTPGCADDRRVLGENSVGLLGHLDAADFGVLLRYRRRRWDGGPSGFVVHEVGSETTDGTAAVRHSMGRNVDRIERHDGRAGRRRGRKWPMISWVQNTPSNTATPRPSTAATHPKITVVRASDSGLFTRSC